MQAFGKCWVLIDVPGAVWHRILVDEGFLNLRTLEQDEKETPSVNVVLSWRDWHRHSTRRFGGLPHVTLGEKHSIHGSVGASFH